MLRKPAFRLFLFLIDTIFIAACIFLFGDLQAFACTNITAFFQDIIYTTVVIGLVPLLSALALGGLGNKAFNRISAGAREFSDYLLIILLLLVNTYFTSRLLSHEIAVFGQDIEIKYIHFMVVALSTLFVYQNYLFGSTTCAARCKQLMRFSKLC
jgi:hypothetical protein